VVVAAPVVVVVVVPEPELALEEVLEPAEHPASELATAIATTDPSTRCRNAFCTASELIVT
jgi:hypothetical protein